MAMNMARSAVESKAKSFLPPFEHATALRFDVEIDGTDLGSWSQCSGLSVKFDNKLVADPQSAGMMVVPGKPTFTTVTLKRAVNKSGWEKVQGWLGRFRKDPRPTSAKITLRDSWSEHLVTWDLRNVVPASWKGPDLDASSAKVAMETLELSHDGFFGGPHDSTKVAAGGRFEVEIHGHGSLGAWTSCQGLKVEFPASDGTTGGGNQSTSLLKAPTYGEVTLKRILEKRGLSDVHKLLHKWADDPTKQERPSATITLWDGWGREVSKWVLSQVIPSKWEGPSLDASKSDVPFETLVLKHAGFLAAPTAGGPGQSAGETSGSSGSLERSKAKLIETPQKTVEFPTDPKNLRIVRGARYLTVPHAMGAKPAGHGRNEYRGTEAATLSADLELHTTDANKAIDKQLTLLENWTRPSEPGKPPPQLTLKWCELKFTGYLRQVSVAISRFEQSTAKPSHATVAIVLQEEANAPPKQNPTSGGIAGNRAHLLAEGDSLQSVAFREYGDATRWRALAAANGIDDPLRVAPGTRLLLPPDL